MKPIEEMNRIFSKKACFQRWLDIEASLARAQASLDIIPKWASDQISQKANVELIDFNKYEEIYQQTAHPLVSLLQIFRPIIGEKAAKYIHLGPTTQDIIDTGTVLALKEAHKIIYETLRRIEDNLLRIVEKHANTIMAGRTHLIQALPITFGYKVAIWAREIRRNIQRLKECRKRIFVIQLSGAVGTMAAFGPKGPEIQTLVAKDLDLGIPDISWHASRDRFAEFTNILALIGSCLGRIGQEVYRLMATEVAEVYEPWKKGIIGSSSMPHKINPQISQHMVSLAKRLKYNASYIIEAMMVDHERNLEHFLGEREKLEESCIMIGELLTYAEDLARDIIVNPQRMKINLNILRGLLLSESVMIELAKKIGRPLAYEIIYEDAIKCEKEGLDFRQVLLEDQRVIQYLNEADIDRLLDPYNSLGFAPQMAKEVLSLSLKEREED